MVDPDLVSLAIDEFPVLFVAAACAEGCTTFSGIGELRVKESDRIDAMATGLRAAGVAVDEGEDWWPVHGEGFGRGRPRGFKRGLCLGNAFAALVDALLRTGKITLRASQCEPGFPGRPGFGQLLLKLRQICRAEKPVTDESTMRLMSMAEFRLARAEAEPLRAPRSDGSSAG